MSENHKLIQYLSLVLMSDLEKSKSRPNPFVDSDPWRLYLATKKLCELVFSERISERQLQELDETVHALVDLRIKLSKPNIEPTAGQSEKKGKQVKGKATKAKSSKTQPKLCQKTKSVPSTSQQKKGKTAKGKAKGKKGGWKYISPKGTFLLSYKDIIQETGTLGQYSTIRLEGKNGFLKRRARLANNKKNILKTTLRLENEYQAATQYEGLYSDSKLSIGSSMTPSKDLKEYIVQEFGSDFEQKLELVNSVKYKSTPYSNKDYHSVLLYNENQTDFSVGKVMAFLVPATGSNPIIVHQNTKKEYVEHLGVYKVDIQHGFNHTLIDDLAHYYPYYLYNPKNTDDLFLTLKSQPYLVWLKFYVCFWLQS